MGNEACVWTDDDDAVLVKCLKDMKAQGKQAQTGWKPEVWPVCKEVLEKDGSNVGAEKTTEKIKSHWGKIRGEFMTVKKLFQGSGFGYNAETKMFFVPKNVWSSLLEVNPSYKKWRNKSYPLYDDLYDLIEGTVATGEGVLVIGGTPSAAPPAAATPGKIKAQKSKKEKIDPKVPVVQAEDDRSSSPHLLDLLSDADKLAENNDADLVNIEDSSSDVETRASKRKKRVRAGSAEPRKRQRPSIAGAGNEMATAMSEVAASLRFGPPTTPQRLQNAFVLVDKLEPKLTDEEFAVIAEVFQADQRAADIFTSMAARKPAQMLFIQKLLRDHVSTV